MATTRGIILPSRTHANPAWRGWIAILAIALIGATSASAIWHSEHETDRDCTVCKLRHDSVADLSDMASMARGEARDRVLRAPRASLLLLGHIPRPPARAPPAWPSGVARTHH